MRVTGWEMRAVGEPLVRTERELREPLAHEAVVQVAGCGVCHTDLGFLFDGVPTRKPLPLVLGHEVAGTVERASGAFAGLVGKAVIVPAVIPCGGCDLCRRGRGDICKAQVFPGNDDHGGFASHLIVPARGLCVAPLPATDPAFAALSVCADAVSTAYAAVKKSGLAAGDFAVFVGAGGVGGFGAQIAAALGARVLCLDVDDARLALMKEHGASWTLNVRGLSAKDVKAKVREIAKAEKLPQTEWKIFETSGSGPGQEAAFALLVHGAVLSVVGFHPGDVTVRLSNLMAFAARAEGTWGCAPELFPEVVALVGAGRVKLAPFVEVHAMDRINEVLGALKRHELKKRPVLVP
jgi:6-hydroxycyclohex-1-ene-1-carbonyl-CoA dehydrogenase